MKKNYEKRTLIWRVQFPFKEMFRAIIQIQRNFIETTITFIYVLSSLIETIITFFYVLVSSSSKITFKTSWPLFCVYYNEAIALEIIKKIMQEGP